MRGGLKLGLGSCGFRVSVRVTVRVYVGVSVGVRVRGCMVMQVRVDGMVSRVRVWSRVVRVLSRVGRG